MERTRRLRCEPLEERLLLTSVPPAGGIEETAVILCGGLQAADSPVSVLPGTEAIRASLLRQGADLDALTEEFIFALDSCPSASCTIYLDFTGHTTTGTRWNSEHDSPAIVTPAYDLDGDPASFSNDELLGIYEIWLRVSEDFAPFEVSVTTRQPQAGDLIRTDALDTRYGIRCCIGGSDTDWYNDSAGGVAYVGSFTNDSDTPCFIFSGDQSTPKAVAETVSHEVGHSLGLSHDGIYTDSAMTSYSAYYRGTDGWAPIMGSADNAPVSQWSRGEYPGATNTEEDLAIILGNGFSYRADDIGDTFAAARTVTISSSEALSLASGESVTLASGIIERSGDIDFFRLVLEEKLSSYLVVGGVVDVTNLNANVCLYDADYQCLGSYNPTAWMNAAVDLSGLLTGTYYLSVEGSAQIAGDTVIFSDYASIGAYTLELTDQLPCADVPDSIGMALDLEWEGDRAVHTDLLGNGAAQYFSSGIAYRDVDMYRFSVAPSEVGTDYTFTLFQTSGWNLSVRIFDDQGNELTSAYRWEEEFSLRFTPQRGGCYYLGICLGGGYDPHSSTGIYYTGATPFEVTVAAKRQQKTSELSGLTLSSRTPSPGETLTAAVTPGDADVRWAWYRVDASGGETFLASANRYTVTDEDLGCSLRVEAAARGGSYTGSVSGRTETIISPTLVTTLDDTVDASDGKISLREALNWAVAHDAGRVTFDPSLAGGTLTLSLGALEINGSVTIDASSLMDGGTPGLTLRAGAERLFTVGGGTSEAPVILAGLALVGGAQVKTGGCLYNEGTLVMRDCVVSGGTAQWGGGIYGEEDSSLILQRVTLRDNSASVAGGAVACYGNLTVDASVFRSNSCSAGQGGAVYFQDPSAGGVRLCVSNSLFCDNSAGDGGGLSVWVDDLTEAVLVNLTVVRNRADDLGGGLMIAALPDSSPTAALFNCLVLGNGSDKYSYGADICGVNGCSVAGYHCISDYAGWSDSSRDCFSAAPGDLFTDFSGGDYTLSNHSAAVDRGESSCAVGTTDLAGNARVWGETVDIGAYEYFDPNAPTAVLDSAAIVQQGCSTLFSARRSAGEGVSFWWEVADRATGTSVTGGFRQGDALYWFSSGDLSPGDYLVRLRVRNAEGLSSPVTEQLVTVLAGEPVMTVDALPLADGRALRLALGVGLFDTAVGWTINWGDGTLEAFDRLSNSLSAAHYYAAPGAEYRITASCNCGGSVFERVVLRFTVPPEEALDAPISQPLFYGTEAAAAQEVMSLTVLAVPALSPRRFLTVDSHIRPVPSGGAAPVLRRDPVTPAFEEAPDFEELSFEETLDELARTDASAGRAEAEPSDIWEAAIFVEDYFFPEL